MEKSTEFSDDKHGVALKAPGYFRDVRAVALTFFTSLTTKCNVLAGPNFCRDTKTHALLTLQMMTIGA